MREQLLRHFPRARYTGLEVSQYLCEQHGWVQGSVADLHEPRGRSTWSSATTCFQYLPSRPAAAALRNLAQLCAGVLHFGALTQEDWDLYCDKRRTDRNVHIRPADWYRRRLRALVHQRGLRHVRAPRRARAPVGARPGRSAAFTSRLGISGRPPLHIHD